MCRLWGSGISRASCAEFGSSQDLSLGCRVLGFRLYTVHYRVGVGHKHSWEHPKQSS